MRKLENSGFIVHPFETDDNQYDATFGVSKKAFNMTNYRKFKTLKQAKNYLKVKGVKTANYDSPSGVKVLKLGAKGVKTFTMKDLRMQMRIERKAKGITQKRKVNWVKKLLPF